MWVYVYLSIYLSIVSMYSDRNAILLDQRTGFLFIHRTTFATLIPHALILFRAVHWEQNVSWDCTRGERSWIYHTWRLYKLFVHLTTLPLGIEGVYVLSHFRHVPLFPILWTAALHAPLFIWIFQASTRVGCCALLQGIFSTLKSNHVSYISHTGRQVLYH